MVEESKRSILCVDNLGFRPRPDAVENIDQYLLSLLPRSLQNQYPSLKPTAIIETLHNISFKARAGEITAILGTEKKVNRALIELIVRRKKYGVMSGNVYICPDTNRQNQTNSPQPTDNNIFVGYQERLAFVPSFALHIPGLTYVEMVHYAGIKSHPDPT